MIAPEQLPLLCKAARHPQRFLDALQVVAAGVDQGSIRNVAFKDALQILSDALGRAWTQHVMDPHFFGGAWTQHTDAVSQLENSLNLDGLHHVARASRLLTETAAQGEVVQAMRAVVNEALPLAQAMAVLRAKVVKGRAPSAGPAARRNPDKLVQTCPCCFRLIAVVGEHMAHHGYKRPGLGFQTASCHGTRFAPLEVSSAGLVWLIGALQAQLASLQMDHSARERKTSLTVRQGNSLREVTPTSTTWARDYRRWVAELQAAITSLQRELPALQRRLDNWKPVQP